MIGVFARRWLSRLELAYIRVLYHGWLFPGRKPEKARIDASTLCQLRCEGCSFQKSNHRGLGGGYLRLLDFESFLNDNPQIKRVELSNYGEIFLNPEFISILQCAFEHGVSLEARMGVNFNTVTTAQLEALVDYRFSFLSISIDGASQSSYGQYRIGGDFDRVIDNIKQLQALKKARGSHYPELSWQYVLNQYNEEEIAKAKQMANDLGIPIRFKLNFLESYKPVLEDAIREQTGLECITREEYLQKKREPYLNDDCLMPFDDPQFNWDGALLGCNRIKTRAFEANLFSDGLKRALRNEKYVRMKELLLQKYPEKERYADLPCWKCRLRHGRVQNHKRVSLPWRPFF